MPLPLLPAAGAAAVAAAAAAAVVTLASWHGAWERRSGEFDGATLTLAPADGEGRLKVKIEAVNGANVGEIEGVAAVDGATARFDPGPAEEGCTVTLRRGQDMIAVETTDGCRIYGGNGVDFSGDYLAPGTKPSFAASFDCRKASTPAEAAVCADELLAEADRALAAAYAAARRQATGVALAQLKSQQLAWIKARDAACAPKAAGERARCLADSYAQRLLALGGTKDMTAYLASRFAAGGDPAELWLDVPLRLHLRARLPEADWDTLKGNMMIVSAVEGASPKAELALSGCVRGVCTLAESWLAVLPKGRLWAAVATDRSATGHDVLVFAPRGAKVADRPRSFGLWSARLTLPKGPGPKVVQRDIF